jgi:para-nitrobenzyl esterase
MGTVVATRSGRIEGTMEGGVECFLGIPYARPPRESMRFRPPREPIPWRGIRSAQSFGAMAPRGRVAERLPLPAASLPESEDCLTVNVWTPSADHARRPVMVWLHGGDFLAGTAGEPVTRGATLAAAHDIVVVSVSYRLGVLGFLYHPALVDSATGVCGNWALLDQIAALQWVRDHIDRLGGDPECVTLFGQTAGGVCASLLATSPLRRTRYRRVIAQSAPPVTTTPERALAATTELLSRCGVNPEQPAQLRKVELSVILDHQPLWAARMRGEQLYGGPVADGVVVAADPFAAAGRGAGAGLELMVGTNRDELRVLGLTDRLGASLDTRGLRKRVEEILADARVDEIIGAYRDFRAARQEPHAPWDIWCAIQTDRLIRAPALGLLAEHASSGSVAYSYLLCWESPFGDGSLGACQGLELPFVFGTRSQVADFAGASAEAYELESQMQGAWAAFARHGNPTHPGIRPWPRFELPRRYTFVFGESCHTESAPREMERAVWDPDR